MANNYYNFPTPFIAGTKVRSEQINTEYQAIETAFDKLPTATDSIIIGTTFFGTEVQGATVNEYIVTTPDPVTPLQNGQRVSFFATHTNDGAVTLNVDGTGLVAGVNLDGDAVVAGQIVSGQFYEWVYDSANTQWLVTKGISGITDPLLLSVGSAAAPTYSFELDPDTGMFQNGADILGFSAGGVEVFRANNLGGGSEQLVVEPGRLNNSSNPSLAFGDGDSGFKEPSDDQLVLLLAGVDKFFWASDTYGSLTGTGPAMLNESASNTNPTLVPDRSDNDTGLGHNGAGEPSLIGNGIELARGVAAGSGGLLVNNALTGGGLERVLTTGDAGGVVGDVFKVGTPVNNEVGVWTGDGTIEGDSNFTWDGSTLSVTGNLTVTGTLTGVGDVFKVGTPVDNQVGVWTGDGTIEGTAGLTYDGTKLDVAGDIECEDIVIQSPAATGLSFQSAGTPVIRNISATSTVPTLIPNKADLDTGIGLQTFDELSLITGGVEALRLAEANSGVIQVPKSDTAVTAFAGGGQGSATQLDDSYNVITTVASSGDSVKLPPVFELYSIIYIKNDGANSADVFPASGDDLGAGVDTAVALAAGTTLSFIATVADSTWTQLVVDSTGGGGGGDVFKVGTPVNDQLAVWTGDGTLEGNSNFNVTGSSFLAATGNGPAIRNVASSSTVPTLIPRQGDLDTGISNVADDRLGLVAGGELGMQLVAGSGGVIHGFDTDATVTAFAGGGQGSATQLNQSYNVVTTVATTGDSVKLPPINHVGGLVYIKNDGANALDVFPASGDDLGQGVDTALSVSAGAAVTFLHSVSNTTWTQIQFETGGGGDVFKVGTPVNNQLGVWTGDGTIEGDANLTWDASRLTIGASGLILPAGSAAGPSQVFTGSLATGWYTPVANVISASIAGVQKWSIQVDKINSAGSGGGLNFAADLTTPGLFPRATDLDTGIGGDGADKLSAVAGGVQGQSWDEANAGVQIAYSSSSAVTAFATGGQGGATTLVDSYNVITTVASPGDSVKLQINFEEGTVIYIKNDGANACDVFPNVGDDLGAGTNTAVSLAAGKSMSFIATVANTTWTQLIIDTGIAGVPDPLQLGNGSAGTPTYSFSADTDTGIFRQGADSLGLSAGGVELLRIVEVASAEQVIVSPLGVQDAEATPSLAFGDGDTGFYEESDDLLAVALAGAKEFEFVKLGDAQFNDVELLANMDGSDGQTTFTEQSNNGASATFVANAELDTAQFRFGSASLLLDGTGDYITFPDIAGYALGSNVWTIEGWVRFNSLPAVGDEMYFISQWVQGGGTDEAFAISLIQDGGDYRFRFEAEDSFGVFEQGGLGGAPALNTWFHWAVQRSASDRLTLWFDGTEEFDATSIFSGAINDSTTTMKLGVRDPTDTGNEGWLDGWLDDVRMTIGSTRYTPGGNITPPTSAFPTNSGEFTGAAVGAGKLFNVVGSLTTPTLTPRNDDDDTGIGGDGSDVLSIIAGGVEGVRFTELNSGVISAPAADVGVTAFATGGQGSATQLDNGNNVITTVATTGDSVKLPPVFAVNSVVYVKNDGANAADIFPASGDNLGAGVDTAVSIAAGTSMSFIATVANSTWTQWIVDTAGTGDVTKVGTPVNNQLGVWTGDGTIEGDANLTWDTSELRVGGHITTSVVGGGEIRNTAADTGPSLLPRNDRITSGWGAAAGSENIRLILDGDIITTRFHTGAADNSVQETWQIVNVTASTTQTQGNGLINGNKYTNVNTVANPNDTITLPSIASGGRVQHIMNSGANTLQIFPNTGDNFAGEATNAAITLAVDESLSLYALTGTEWAFLARPSTATGDVTKVGTPVDNQVGVWTGDGTIEGDTNFQFDGSQLLLLDGTAAAPAYSFVSDPDTGFWRTGADGIGVALGGSNIYSFSTAGFSAQVSSGASLLNEAASGTNPSLVPNKQDDDVGIGSAGSDQLSLIAGGVEGLRITEAAGAIQALAVDGTAALPSYSFINDPDSGLRLVAASLVSMNINGADEFRWAIGQYRGSATGSPTMQNEEATATNPTLVPDQRDTDTGLGHAGANEPSLIGGGVELARGVAAASGGLQANNQDTGGGLERVLTESDLPFPEFQFFADQFENPVNADWTVNALAPAAADSNNNGLTVRLFDDTTEEGVGFIVEVPAGATNIVFDFVSRAETAPGAVNTVGLDIYNRGIPDNAAVQAWSTATQLTDLSIPTNEFFQEDTQSVALSTLGVTAGETTQFELVRTTPTGGTDLTGDWDLLLLKVSFT